MSNLAILFTEMVLWNSGRRKPKYGRGLKGHSTWAKGSDRHRHHLWQWWKTFVLMEVKEYLKGKGLDGRSLGQRRYNIEVTHNWLVNVGDDEDLLVKEGIISRWHTSQTHMPKTWGLVGENLANFCYYSLEH